VKGTPACRFSPSAILRYQCTNAILEGRTAEAEEIADAEEGAGIPAAEAEAGLHGVATEAAEPDAAAGDAPPV
jgi:hypothetical protein